MVKFGLVGDEGAGLAGATPAGDFLVGADLGDGGAASRAGFAALAVDFQEVADFYVDVGGHTVADDGCGFVQHFGDGVVEAAELFFGEGFAFAERGEACFPEDFVDVGVADACDEFAACDDSFDFAGVGAYALVEVVESDGGVEGVGALLMQPGYLADLVGAEVVDAAHRFVVEVAEVYIFDAEEEEHSL